MDGNQCKEPPLCRKYYFFARETAPGKNANNVTSDVAPYVATVTEKGGMITFIPLQS